MTEETGKENKRNLPVWMIAGAFVLLVGFLVIIALGLSRVQSGPIVIGQQVPEIVLTTFEGETLRVSDMNGKVVVINFWASWCKPCEQEAAELEQAWQSYKLQGDTVFLGVDYVDTEREAQRYITEFNISYPNGPDLRTSISQLFRIRGVPETYIIDRSGRLAYVKIGPFVSLEEITNAVNAVREQDK